MRKILNHLIFRQIHGNTIVFNDSREDPRVDRVALELGSDDTMLVITSAGCNVLDYALTGVRQIHAVDVNPLQNALLELKTAGIRQLEFEDFFQIFGQGCHRNIEAIYHQKLKRELSQSAQKFWNKKIVLFSGRRNGGSFYFSGPCGRFARFIMFYIDQIARIRRHVDAMFEAKDLEQQVDIYETEVKHRFWKRPVRWLLGRDTTLALLGVPLAQRIQIERSVPGGVANFIESCLTAVFTEIPLHDNYLWRIYLYGKYTSNCSPEYLKPENFEKLKSGIVDCVSISTSTVADFLADGGPKISRFVLLDHMDWLADANESELSREWQGICDRATPNARIIWRSGGLETGFVDPVEVTIQGQQRVVGDLLTYHHDLARNLHREDRVHTYGSFYIADLMN